MPAGKSSRALDFFRKEMGSSMDQMALPALSRPKTEDGRRGVVMSPRRMYGYANNSKILSLSDTSVSDFAVIRVI